MTREGGSPLGLSPSALAERLTDSQAYTIETHRPLVAESGGINSRPSGSALVYGPPTSPKTGQRVRTLPNLNSGAPGASPSATLAQWATRQVASSRREPHELVESFRQGERAQMLCAAGGPKSICRLNRPPALASHRYLVSPSPTPRRNFELKWARRLTLCRSPLAQSHQRPEHGDVSGSGG